MASSLMKTLILMRSCRLSATTTVVPRNFSHITDQISNKISKPVQETSNKSPVGSKFERTLHMIDRWEQINAWNSCTDCTEGFYVDYSSEPIDDSGAPVMRPCPFKEHVPHEYQPRKVEFPHFVEFGRCDYSSDDLFDFYDFGTSFSEHINSSDQSIEAAKFAISKFNEQDKEGKNLEFLRLVRVNQRHGNGMTYCLTIETSDKNFYEAKVWFKEGGERILRFIHPAKHYPEKTPYFFSLIRNDRLIV